MEWSEDQYEAIKSVRNWYDRGEQSCFHLFGFAGTGKSTIAKELVKEVRGPILFAAFTGKAALVMTRKGTPASTIHQLIYKLVQPDLDRRNFLIRELKQCASENKSKLELELKELEKPIFRLNEGSPVTSAVLVVIDECSMVGEDMGRDLISFGVPILVLGDPMQLPPIQGQGFFTDVPADAMLTEVHRQAKDNPIIHLATEVRELRQLELGTYGSSRVELSRKLKKRDLIEHDIVLVGKNVTRRTINKIIRQMKAFSGTYPVVGDILVCLKNQYSERLFNGLLCEVLECKEMALYLHLKIKTEDGEEVTVRASKLPFEEYEGRPPSIMDSIRNRGLSQFDYGYCLTVHKSQGSQWDSVLVIDDGMRAKDPEMKARWLYTACTRAAERVTIGV